MSRKLPQLWAKKGGIQVSDVGFGFYVVNFESVADYERALFGGPWMVNDHYVVIQEWRPHFRPEDTVLSTLRVWVRLPGIPLEYFDRSILQIIGDRIGRTVRIDNTTLEATQDLGRYLGVPVLHGRVKRSTYEFILERMDKKLAGWKANNLSLAGRVTLASSVLNAIPSYVMQTAFLPVYVCEAIDKKVRDFIWGSVAGGRKIHNINWVTVCKPKNLGGLGLRSARDLNKAFLMKIVWGLVSRPTELWAKVLISKYLKQSDNGYTLARKKGFSRVWRGILKVWPLVTNGLQWSIRDGCSTRFWTDRWVDSGIILVDHALDISRVESSLLVSQACSDSGMWNLDFLHAVLPFNIVTQVVGMSPPMRGRGHDTMVWGLEPKGGFSVRSAYLMITDNADTPNDVIWRYIWNWKGPNKIKHFLWLASHKKLLTNEEREHRHLTNQVLCHRCSVNIESISHVIYECNFAMQVWRIALPQAISARTIHADFDSWWRGMLGDKDFNLQFGVITWILWRARNKLIFEDVKYTVLEVSEQCKFWINLVLSSWKTNQLGREAPGKARQTQLIAWRPGDEGCFILNTDGSRYSHSGSTATGGLIRDSGGRFIQAFTANIGDCSITRAELTAIVQGMKLAWSLGIRRIIVQSDSCTAISILSRAALDNQHAALVSDFLELKARSWEVSIVHVYREANCGADYLANLGHSCNFGLHVFSQPDTVLARWIRYDLIGVALPRVIST
ncbi:Putative ribonuclease H protein At1g65750 [Linum perenne]